MGASERRPKNVADKRTELSELLWIRNKPWGK